MGRPICSLPIINEAWWKITLKKLNSFFMDKTNSHSFLANTFRLLLSAAAYNMVLA
ncbi:Hypothetical protein zj316_0574 [Lactiplantibacillus plantarum ZJ316]|nr:Hypothetical protein zj316_0574 [Lactiplantibacillus plantarum ZJ316]